LGLQRWLPIVRLEPSSLNGWAYLSAKRLYDPPSTQIYMALENLFGRGEQWTIDTGSAGQEDMASKKMTNVEKTEVQAPCC
jgi:hypothetical protein